MSDEEASQMSAWGFCKRTEKGFNDLYLKTRASPLLISKAGLAKVEEQFSDLMNLDDFSTEEMLNLAATLFTLAVVGNRK